MAIAKRPKVAAAQPVVSQLSSDERERQERQFLAGAPDMAHASAETKAKPKRERMQTVHLRFEPELLPQMDAAARQSGHDDRSAWVRYLVKQALKQQQASNG